jgi:hypothetical protein
VRRGRRITARAGASVAIAIVSAALFAGCGDDGGNGEATPAGTSAIAMTTPPPPGILDGNVYTSTWKNYRVTVPDGWRMDEHVIVSPEFSLDVIYGPEDGTGVTPSIQFTCYQDPGPDEQSFVQARRQFAQSFADREEFEEGPSTLAGQPATQFVYTQTSQTTTVKKTEITQLSHGCGWSVTLTSAPDKDYNAVLQEVLSTLAFV